ncbi:unnamed protein product [Spirodela intermedia]|uniref:Uncharacterized protein n=1 Tax=Spirodela intermedia TaxID=51605 RepID=A0A7I8KW82_SPIIN|nr:unnamed protein product [Spirodela intermedia]
MRRVGGPLLCVGDLLQDLSEDAGAAAAVISPCPSISGDASPLPPSHLRSLFEATYDQLTESLAGTDHSWTQLTLKLCSAVETADKLVSLAQSNAEVLLDKVNSLDNIIKRSHSAVEVARALCGEKSKREMATNDCVRGSEE